MLQSERSAETRRRIIDAATERFVAAGYHDTSLNQVLDDAGVSRGALYHHFDSKDALFEAVLEIAEARLADQLVEAGAGLSDSMAILRAGLHEFIRLSASDPVVHHIVLREAPAVLGWVRWREIDSRHGFGLLRAVLETAGVDPVDLDATAHVALAATIELGLLAAGGHNAPERATLERVLDRLVDALIEPA